ncbi:hypothetical protein JKP75_08475 [Blastococcus sp. TML/M2B]|uniref:hypothetical protein n=1 Tax=unclassified Blastococcus TaxID=2619396 RepID=UPI00190D55D0|nr:MULTISPECIES: hypothetical protein [unclassified Blastococcus]MBN1092592.1 hypothetical protein [Blastococcus sp. TML/M2B]MBN1097315.1 hypothetical protein [Blastococcus sp. TML/C7B]
MSAPEETAELPGRALIEQGAPVAGSMSRAAATVVFEPSAALVQIAAPLAACLRTAATEAAAVPVPREQVRAGAALAFAVEYAATRHRAGRPARADGWFDARPGGRPAADDLTEAVVAAARRSTDERRVRHLGYLLAEVSCSPDLDAEVAGRALRLADELSWRRLGLLAAVGRRDRVPLPIAPLPDDPRPWSEWAAREDVADLQRAGLLDPPVDVPRPGATVPRLRAADLRLTRRGVLLHRLLALDLLHEDAVAEALAALGLPRS